jgi:glyoxylase-like metal-dependent hydrolase (beta-lactamase superfamily II)
MHVAFFERSRGWLFAGDAVLAVPTPISRAMEDDLAMYEASLDRLQSLRATALFPGHGTQLVGTAEQIDAAIDRSRQYVLDHRAAVREALAGFDAPIDLLSLSLALTPDGKPYEPLTRWDVHVSSTDAHLHWLVDRGEVERIVDASGPRYRLVS